MGDTDKILNEVNNPIAIKLFDGGFVSGFTKEQIGLIRKQLGKN